MIVTDNKSIYKKLLLLRNHGLKNRDEVELLGFNSRLDTFQSIVGNWLLPKAKSIAKKRIENAKFFDRNFSNISEIRTPKRSKKVKHVFHLYIVFAKRRDQLLKYCLKKVLKLRFTILFRFIDKNLFKDGL